MCIRVNPLLSLIHLRFSYALHIVYSARRVKQEKKISASTTGRDHILCL